MAVRTLPGRGGWTLRRSPRAAGGRRGGGGSPVVPPQFLQSDAVSVEDAFDAVPSQPSRRGSGPPELALDVDVPPGQARLLAVRHPSGALTFHRSVEQPVNVRGGAARRAVRSPSIARFRVPVRRLGAEQVEGGRRGVVSTALKVAVIKVSQAAVDAAVSAALPQLAAAWERRAWTKHGLREGWFKVSPASGASAGLTLSQAVPKPGARNLLLVHGTFSNAASAFNSLATTGFFDAVRPTYGDRIFAFNHFSISRTPDENARQLLEGLPADPCRFDAITHSRGGLVLRSLVENHAAHGSLADRFQLGHAILVASPNDGTPLATPSRWNETVGWFANLMELFPDNPFTTGAEFVSEALVWLASHLTGDLPGLRSMDAAGDLVAGLQAPPGPPPNAYSALVSNVHPTGEVWQRALDVGVDSFFASANDLVVPTEGGWRIDRDGTPHIPASRIGCFGPGGNITPSDTTPVNHVSFFSRSETSEFLVKALAREPHGLAAIDPDAPLPDRRFPVARSAARSADISAARPESRPSDARRAILAGAPSEDRRAALSSPRSTVDSRQDDVDTLHIVVMDDGTAAGDERGSVPRVARIFATYAGARVTTQMRLRADKGEPPTRFGRIISVHERIKNYTNRMQGSLPTDEQMIAFGRDLFETLFQGEVRRLYDEARSRQRERKLDLVLTSMISWIAEKPWEFAYDAARRSFLATEDVHFVRNVLTSVPADAIAASTAPLRVLVVSAQPVGFGQLSIDQEVAVIRRGFEPLIESGLAEVETIARATPAAIHGRLSTSRFDIVHFIGHGVFDEETQEGCLVFEDERGGELRLGARSSREIFSGRGLSLVFLNACQTGAGGRSDFNKGIAQALVSHGLPALVANQYSVLDSSATSFAQHFYWSLAQGMSIGAAAREARIAVNYSLAGELIDWAVPVVYARDPNKALATPGARGTSVPVTTVRAGSRRATLSRPIRVAVWDVDDVFPALARTLERMHEAQSVYGFELVDMSVPLDAWDMEHRAVDGSPYLWAERFARRIASKTVELRVDLLACVTRHWLRDDTTLDMLGWWPANRKPPVVMFSCAGVADLQPEGPQTDRVITNAMVTALAGFFGGFATHKRAPRSCPLSYHKTVRIAQYAGPQKFDRVCRRIVASKLPTELPAMEALLQLFA